MKSIKITILTDYKNVFLSKMKDKPYRSGMDKKLISQYFNENNFEVDYLQFSDIDFNSMNFKSEIILYTSSEDIGYHYKGYIEDIILGLHLQGAILIPDYKYLRANNNKNFMEILRSLMPIDEFNNIKSLNIGVYEDLLKNYEKIKNWNQFVIKPSAGAMSKGVELAHGKKDLFKKVKSKSLTFYFFQFLKDLARKYVYKGYQLESNNRKRLIIQQFIPNLKNDWKVLIYFDKIFILKRYVRPNDFRSSGSGNFVFDDDIPNGLLDYCYKIFLKLDLPQISIDVCYDGTNFYIIEYQAIYFGTTTIEYSPFYFLKRENQFEKIVSTSILEEVYTYSISKFIHSTFQG